MNNDADLELDRMADMAATETGKPSSPVKRILRGIGPGLDWIFGLLALFVGLSILSIIPILNFLSLGYLLQASGRVASTGRFRDGFIGIRKASVLGSLALGSWLLLLPLRFVSGLWNDAELIAPGSHVARSWHIAVVILAVLTFWHIAWAGLRGGRLRHFLWPAPRRFFKWLSLKNKYRDMRNALVEYLVGLRLPGYFWLGMRGFLGALIWLIPPVGILILASYLPPEGGALLSLVGALLLTVVVLYLPFLQTHFARTRRFKAMFEINYTRKLFNQAPVAFWLALLITLLFAIPLYLLKIELPPREAAWLPSLVFVGFIFPARLLTGWAVSRARRRALPAHFIFRWTSRFAAVPVALLYVLCVYLTQYLSWYGSLGLLEQHAFLVPAPLMSL